MNTPNPLVPQGTLERQSKGKSTIRIAIFTIISIHAVFFAGLLMQGCRRDDGKAALKTADAITNQNTLPPLDTGYYPTQEVVQAAPPPAPEPAAANNPLSNIVSEAPSSFPSPAALEPAPEGKPYSIVKGDTLAKIAKANGVSLTALTKANPDVDPARLKVGQKIQIPAGAAATAGTGAVGFAEPGKGEPGSGTLYSVKPGETLTRIARQHGTTPKAIRAANNLKTDRLLVGQKLRLPAPASTSASTTKTSAVSKLSATNPAHVSPAPSVSSGTNLR